MEANELYAVGSIIGSVRSRNEDVGALAVIRHGGGSSRDFTVALVCDGMGGMSDGREAALTAASSFLSAILRIDRTSGVRRALNLALNAAQRAVYDELRGSGGTTLSAVYMDASSEAWFVHVGDSRIYELRANSEPRQISRDDTIGAALQRQQDNRPDNNRLIQFVGLDGELDPQLLPIEKNSVSGFLLTSDGAHSPPPEILATIAKHSKSGPELVRKLLNVADALGGRDNATAVHIPASMEVPASKRSDGPANDDVIASILCSSGQHDIWFAEPVFRNALSRVPASELHNERNPKPFGDPPAKNKAPKKPKQSKAKNNAPAADELPLGVDKPIAKLDFSDDGDGAS